MVEVRPDPFVDAALDRAAAVIDAAPALTLACHVDPDGDALGSMLALHHLCRSHGKPAVATWSEPFVVAPHYTFLPGLSECTPPAEVSAEPDIMVTFDCGSLGRLAGLRPTAEWARRYGELVVIDHHSSNDRYGSVNLVDPTAAASAVLVRRLAERLGWPLTQEAALCLYTGLVTDTGRFQYDNTTAETFTLAAELASFDLPIATITRQLFEEHRFAYLQLVAQCLGRAELDRELGFVATWVTARDLQHHGVEIEETEGLIDLVRRASEARVSCVLKEVPGGLRVSLRAVADIDGCDIDVGAIAARFGGGGHRFSAGFTTDASIPSVLVDLRRAMALGSMPAQPATAWVEPVPGLLPATPVLTSVPRGSW
jgi:phosphoesterase RecJ-like protein